MQVHRRASSWRAWQVGYSWIDGLKAHAEEVISDDDMATAPVRRRDRAEIAPRSRREDSAALRAAVAICLTPRPPLADREHRCGPRVPGPGSRSTPRRTRRRATSAPSSTRTSPTTTTATASRPPCQARSARDLRAICARSARDLAGDLAAFCLRAICARSARDLRAICARSARDLTSLTRRTRSGGVNHGRPRGGRERAPP